MVASAYRHDRIFIGGDAAHQHPPYGAYGLNTGLEDAVNLGWKLAATLQGWGGERLLDSYEAERRPVFSDVADLIAAGIETDWEFLERHQPERDRNDFERAWRALPEKDSPFRLHREPTYAGSPIVCGAPGAARRLRRAGLGSGARGGAPLHPAPCRGGEDVFTRLGAGFTRIVLDGNAAAVRAFEDAARSLRVPLTGRLRFGGGRSRRLRGPADTRPTGPVRRLGRRCGPR